MYGQSDCLLYLLKEKYLGITRPLTYPARQNGQLMAKMILGVWLVSASITLPPFCGWAKNVHTGGVCLISQDLGYTVYSTAVAFYIPMLTRNPPNPDIPQSELTQHYA
ncbi:hypothetical protein AALO_G00065120 [Alosa alosa]|uniref:G-protein coupled receptors family 1 profile domain-containing protein n=1 Tax=Alosa alosa TaxID=278164 RepID=A0AAV6H4F5_9TELE|nr:hypothetical protein AALO_G00065120 [Alosa alosa]